MTVTMPWSTGSRFVPLTPLYFAQHTTRELDDDDFDEDEFDDFDDFRSKRPRRRPFLKFTLLLLLIAGIWYLWANPDVRSSMSQRMAVVISIFNPGPADRSLHPGNGTDPASLSQTVPIPVFHEGQQTIVTLTGEPQARLRLSLNAEGTPHGHSVKTGDVLTVTDGMFVKHQWVYSVKTPSEDSGWIPEKYLRAHF